MVKYSLDGLFSSFSDETRRDILRRLLHGEQTVSQLADAYKMSLPAVSKHLKLLKTAGLVVKEKRGRQWFVQLASDAVEEVAEYVQQYKTTLHNRLDSFGAYVRQQPTAESPPFTNFPKKRQTITITEVLDVSPDAVWQAYTDPASILQWWKLPGAELVAVENDVRVGGSWRFTVRGVDNQEYVLSGTYSTVTFPRRLEYTDGVGDINTVRPKADIIVTFEPLPNGKTLLTKKSVATPAVHQLNAAWYQVIGRG